MLHTSPPFIAIGNYDFRPSGTVVKSIEIAIAAAEAGLPVQLWVVRDDGALRARVPAKIPIVEVGSALRLHSRGLDLAINIPSLAATFRRHRPTMFLSGGNHLHLAARAALLMSGERRFIGFGARASNSAHHGRTTPWRSLVARVGNRLKFGGSDFVVAVSHALGEEIHSALPRKRLVVIPNGVNLTNVAHLAAQPFDHPFFHETRGPILVTMGRLVRQKGFDILIAAFARIGIPGARLMIIGDGSEDQLAALESLARREGVADRVAFLGYQANPFAVMAKAHIFVSASRWEGASNALIEALACGLPLVATDCPTGNREVVEAGPYGTLAPVEDVEGMSVAILAELAICRSREAQSAGAHGSSLDRCLDQWTFLLWEELQKWRNGDLAADYGRQSPRNLLTGRTEDF